MNFWAMYLILTIATESVLILGWHCVKYSCVSYLIFTIIRTSKIWRLYAAGKENGI
jgi:hypothetical protein